MKKYVRLATAAALVACLSLASRPSSAGDADKGFKQFLPPEAYKELVGRAVKNIEEAVAEKSTKGTHKAQFNAAMIACYTLSARDVDAEHLAAARAAAAKVAALLKDKGKHEEAVKLAGAIPTIKGPAEGKVAAADLKGFVPARIHVMEHFEPKAKGGDGIHPSLMSNIKLKGALNSIEEKIRALGNKPIANVEKEAAELELLGYRSAAAAELIYLFAPAQKAKKGGTPEDWRQASVEMREAGVALAEAAKKKDGQAIFKAGGALNGACNRCHSDFK
jgi:hypothetical protein